MKLRGLQGVGSKLGGDHVAVPCDLTDPVGSFVQRTGADYERWLAGMRRRQAQFAQPSV